MRQDYILGKAFISMNGPCREDEDKHINIQSIVAPKFFIPQASRYKKVELLMLEGEEYTKAFKIYFTLTFLFLMHNI